MERIRNFPLVLAAASIAAIGAPTAAQAIQDPGAEHVAMPHPHAQPMPFLPDDGTGAPVYSIQFLTAEQMSPQDRDLAADAESSIAERAGFVGLEFNQGQWSYRQMLCPALPNHLLLQFTRNGGTGDVSMFSASVPRGDSGHVRIIPIQRRGYSLFSPAPINALTISAFNRIRAEEPTGSTPAWLTTGLCYAALTGAHPQAMLPVGNSAGQNFPESRSAILDIPGNGGAIISFRDESTPSRPMQWSMTFDGRGKLLKASHAPASGYREKAVPPLPAEMKGKPVPQAGADLQGRLVPPASPVKVTRVPPDSNASKPQAPKER